MTKYFSKKEPEKLLHVIVKKSDITLGRKDVIPEENYIQCAILNMRKDTTFKPHKHIWKDSKITKVIAQESWVVVKGKIKVEYYDLNNELLETFILTEGDCTITLYGGHNYTSLTDDSLVYEFKTGPYEGQANDKEPI